MEPAADFRIIERGPFDYVAIRAARPRALRAAGLALVAWVPLLVLSLVAAPQDGAPDITFWEDVSTHVRFLFVVPLLILVEGAIGGRTGLVMATFLDAGLVSPADRPRFTDEVRRAHRLLDSVLVEVALIALVTVAVSLGVRRLLADDTLFWFEQGSAGAASLAPAGWWFAAVSPIPGFLLARWVWRYAIWCRLLHRASKLDLRLVGSHPDRAGGLGFVSVGHTAFAAIGLAASSVVASAAATEILHAGVPLASYKNPLIAFVVIAAAIGLAPFPIFFRKLTQTKRSGILAYSALATRYAQSFERKWLDGDGASDELLGSGDIQSLADLGGSFDRLTAMRPSFLDRTTVIAFAAAAAIPILPLALTVIPLREILKKLLHALV